MIDPIDNLYLIIKESLGSYCNFLLHLLSVIQIQLYTSIPVAAPIISDCIWTLGQLPAGFVALFDPRQLVFLHFRKAIYPLLASLCLPPHFLKTNWWLLLIETGSDALIFGINALETVLAACFIERVGMTISHPVWFGPSAGFYFLNFTQQDVVFQIDLPFPLVFEVFTLWVILE